MGNQLFQIAAGYAHSRRIGSNFAINYSLNHAGFGQGHHPEKYRYSVYKNIPVTQQNPSLVYTEREFTYRPIQPLDNLCLHGYFQSEKYFIDYKKEVKNLICFDFENKKKISKKLNSIQKKVGIHVRLGDYLNKEHDGIFHLIDYPSYIDKAMSYFGNDHNFLIFSDDLNTLKKKWI